MDVAITGASGFIGRRLVTRLRDAGNRIRTISTRKPVASGDLDRCDAVVHLAGEPVAQRWTASAKRKIRESRVDGTRMLVEAMRDCVKPPAIFISGSAIGYYGSRGDEILTESSAAGSDFLARIAAEWEQEASRAKEFGARTVTLRTGVVLGKEGGALPKILLPFRFGFGGRLGNGNQWMSWIHLEDQVRLIEFALATSAIEGPLNGTAPNPVTNREFTRALAAALHRPAIFPVPAAALRLILGEMSEAVLGSERVIPESAIRAGFNFKFPTLEAAFADLLV